jgi:hypothetical protein
MFIAEMYSHKNGEAFINERYSAEFQEIKDAIANIDAIASLSKKSDEKTKASLLFSPVTLNEYLKKYLCELGWTEKVPGSGKGFREPRISMGAGGEFREMDGIKNKVGLEIQFGKYAFMAYDILSKMPIFHKRGLIECGIELVAMPSIVKNMSTGVSSFTQIVSELKERGHADLDIPTLIIGIDCDKDEWNKVAEKRERFLSNPADLHLSGEVRGARNGSKPGPKNY